MATRHRHKALLIVATHRLHAAPAGLKNCMRIKLDMSAANKALRDPVAFRCNLTHHWRTGHTYKVGAGQLCKPCHSCKCCNSCGWLGACTFTLA